MSAGAQEGVRSRDGQKKRKKSASVINLKKDLTLAKTSKSETIHDLCLSFIMNDDINMIISLILSKRDLKQYKKNYLKGKENVRLR